MTSMGQIDNKCGCHIKNTQKSINIINVHRYGTQIHMGIKFEVSYTNISGAIHINLNK